VASGRGTKESVDFLGSWLLEGMAMDVFHREREIVRWVGRLGAVSVEQIYAHYAPSAREVEMVNAAFTDDDTPPSTGNNSGNNLSATEDN
jgi:hypothetical protein